MNVFDMYRKLSSTWFLMHFWTKNSRVHESLWLKEHFACLAFYANKWIRIIRVNIDFGKFENKHKIYSLVFYKLIAHQLLNHMYFHIHSNLRGKTPSSFTVIKMISSKKLISLGTLHGLLGLRLISIGCL